MTLESSMPTVLVIAKYYPPYFGGIELVTKQCVDALHSKCKVVVLCHNVTNTTATETDGNTTIVRCATPLTPFRQPISFAMVRQILSCRADVIHFHAPNFWGAALLLLLKPHRPLLITHHADVEGRRLLRMLLMPLYKLLLHRAVNVTVSSRKNYRRSRDLSCEDVKVVEIPFGLNPDIYASLDHRNPSPHDDVPLVFGFCGRLVWYKGLDVLLHAFGRLDSGHLWIVGDGPLRKRTEALAQELGIADRVMFHGRVSDERKIELIKAMDVFVLPSTHITETFGISQVEAQMCGVPCISSNLPTGVSDVVDPEGTGILVTPGDAAALEVAMRRMMVEPEFRLRCGRAARIRAEQLFSENAFRRRYVDLVTGILERVRNSGVDLALHSGRK